MKKGYYAPIESLTEANTDFRRVLYTGESLQLVLMTLAPGEEIGMETHHENDQFFRFETGEGKVVVNETEHLVHGGDCVIVPKGAVHNIINTSMEHSLTMYTIYTPPHHKDGTVHPTKEYALSHEEEFEGATTEG